MRLNEEEGGCSIAKIREALNSLTVTKISIKEETIYLKNKPEPLAMKIMRKLKISPSKK